MDLVLQIGLSNSCFALALAILATLVGAKAKRHHLAHMLWVLVFVRLVTPPIVTVPVGISSPQPDMITTHDDSPTGTHPPVILEYGVEVQSANAETAQAPSLLSHIGTMLNDAKPLLASIWLLGMFSLFAWSVRRVFYFTRLLKETTKPAPHELQTTAATIAAQLKLNTFPEILITSAHLSPMVWWIGGRVQVVIPTSLLDEMDASEWRWVLAHESAHVRRRDYLVRWLEWLACNCFWWNPVAWWAQRNLRETEEVCCDALVVSCLKPNPHSYANSLLTAVEFLAYPILRPPAMASEINSGRFLERRFHMIVSETPRRANSRWLQACVLLCAIVMLPFGVAYAQDYEAVERRLGEAVSQGELTLEQAGTMMAALKKDRNEEEDCAGIEERIEDRIQAVGERLKAAVQAGKLTEEEAWTKWHKIKEEKIARRLKAAVAKGEMSEEKAWGIWRGIEKSEIAERLKSAVAKGKLTEEESWAKWIESKKDGEHDAEIEGHYKRMGVSTETLDRVRIALNESGLQDKQIKQALGGMLRVVNKAHSEGEKFELDPRLRNYFQEEVGLTDKKIERVMGLARRVAHGLKNRSEGNHDAEIEGHYKRMGVSTETLDRIRIALNESGLQDKQIKQALGEMLRVVNEAHSEGEKFELDPWLRNYFQEEVGLTDKQIERVMGLARRVAHGLREQSSNAFEDSRTDEYRTIEAHIRAAIKAREITAEQAE